MIALSRGYESLVLGRLLQGISAGLIGVVVPLYWRSAWRHRLAARDGIFQWLLTLAL